MVGLPDDGRRVWRWHDAAVPGTFRGRPESALLKSSGTRAAPCAGNVERFDSATRAEQSELSRMTR